MTGNVLSIPGYAVHTPRMNTYADDLKQHRERANLTVRELAAAIDRSTTFITDFELRKKSNPPEPAMMERIAQVLRWPVSDQLQAWGYPLDAAENRANPFARDDPRYAFVETLQRFDLSDEYDAYATVTVAQLLRTLDSERDRFKEDMLRVFRPTRANSGH